ncbi:hypothetical protein C2G38_2212573 [Gigaspora rosea]|uniref:Uncharacterized protein n=1 Tax=Gigaspora rosea TaxID=44941 RepID=A0A397UCM9_9GLOM|nr:hypothetical protein C2G38_2212573 [Gigaspora rosea]
MKKRIRINKNKIYDVTLKPPDNDNLLNLHTPDETFEKFKIYLKTQKEDKKASNLSKKDNDLSRQTDKAKEYHRDTKKCSRRSRYSKNLLSVTQILKEHNLREAFFKITKLTNTDLCDKDISSIIEEFVKIRLVFKF